MFMEKKIGVKIESKLEYVAFRTSKDILEKLKKFCVDKGFSVGEMINISVLNYMGETELLNRELQRKILK